MTAKSAQARDFLRTRRAKLEPGDVGLPVVGGNRRVPGLRREEVAILAGVSVDYYTRLEKGNLSGVSDSVLDAIARALQMDEAERSYLFDLARAANAHGRPARSPRSRRAPHRLRIGVDNLIASLTDVPVMAYDRRLDILGLNELGRLLFASILDSPTRRSRQTPANLARFVFLDPAAERFYLDRDDMARTCVGMLRAEAGRAPHDVELSALIGELSTRSVLFARLWAEHEVLLHAHGVKTMHHDLVGDIELGFETFPLDAGSEQVIIFYYALPGTPAVEQLGLLGSWAVTTKTAGTTTTAETTTTTEEH